MDFDTFRTEIVERINSEYEETDDKRESFVAEIASGLCDLSQCDGFNPCYYNGGGPNNKKIEIDGFFFDDENKIDGTLSLFCCKYTGSKEPGTFTKTDIETVCERVTRFVKHSFDDTVFKFLVKGTPAYNVAKSIKDWRGQIERFRIHIITDDRLSDRIIKGLNIEYIDGKQTHVAVWDIEKYYGERMSKRVNQDIDIVLEDYGYQGISCIKANEISEGADYDAYLCVMPGKLLSEFYGKYGSQLLESNVRSFLSFRGKVNKGIRDSIKNEPKRFFAYNNGITTTANEIELEDTPEGLKITRMKSLQIVNGGQTTATLYSATTGKNPSDISDVYVPMKICVIPEKAPEDITRLISEYSNSQNKVGKSDFFSNSPFHIKIERISRRTSAPAAQGSVYSTKWYYERARGSYLQETLGMVSSEVKKFQRENPKNQVMTKTDFARYKNTMELKPYDVSKAPEANFVRFGEDVDRLWKSTKIPGSDVNDRYFKDAVAIAIIYEALRKKLTNRNVAPWVVSGEGKCLTSYSISKLIHMLKKKEHNLNLDVIWNMQSAPEELLEQLIYIAEKIRERLQIEIEDTSRNLFDFCKSKTAWDIVWPMNIDYIIDMNKWVVSSKRTEYNTRTARKDETRKEIMNNNIWVVSKGSGYWERVINWGVENRQLKGFEIEILTTAARMDGTGKPPSDKQCNVIKQIWERLQDEGMEL